MFKSCTVGIVVDDDGEPRIMDHAWEATNAYRRVQSDELEWEGDTLVVKGPEHTPQLNP